MGYKIYSLRYSPALYENMVIPLHNKPKLHNTIINHSFEASRGVNTYDHGAVNRMPNRKGRSIGWT